MFTVYKITNNKNNKCYIGSSTRVLKRWQNHKSISQNPNHKSYNYPLYAAFRKYGINNFTFEIIKDDFDSISEMEEYEAAMIKYYNSIAPNGYNQTLFTNSNHIASENAQKHIQKISCKCAKVDANENILEKYSSYHEAARLNGKDGDDNASRVRAVCKGDLGSCFEGLYFRDLNENEEVVHQKIKRHKGKKAIIGININNPTEEIYFNSISEAAATLNTERKSISSCIQGSQRYSFVKGYIFRELDLYGNIVLNDIDIEERILEYEKRNPVINGERHSITEWCNIYNIKTNTVNARLRRGWDPVEAITTPVQGGE